MYDLVTIGETMLRLAPPNFARFAQATTFDLQIGGAESNVAVALSCLGFRAAWMSRLPDNDLGHRAASELNRHGVDTSGVRFAPNERIGTYFVELSVPPRPNRVIYDRANSAASRMSFDDIDTEILGAAKWLHLTGITVALSDSCFDMVSQAINFARKSKIAISFDVNYRALLWSANDASKKLAALLSQCDVVICAHRDAIALFDATDEPTAAAKQMSERFGCKTLVLTLGENGAMAIENKGDVVHAPQTFQVNQMVDRIGAGDAFDAGFIAAKLWKMSLGDALNYGNALSAIKMTMPGDVALVKKVEVDSLVRGARNASAR